MRHFIVSFSVMLALAGNAWSQSMTEGGKNFKTWCVGRFVVDLPLEAEFGGEDNEYDFTGINTSRLGVVEFSKQIESKTASLKFEKHELGESMLAFSDGANDISSGKIIGYWGNQLTKRLIQIDAFKWEKGVAVTFSTQATPDKKAVAIDLTKQILKKLQLRKSDELPTRPGFCTHQAFIPDEGRKHESARVSFRFKQHPDVSLSIWTATRTDSGPDLIERGKKSLLSLGAKAVYIQTLREVDRDLGPLKGQESLEKAPGHEGYISHSFTWEHQGQGRSDYPAIRIHLGTALQLGASEGRPSSLTDREALELWDAILNSFRLRPTGGAATPEQPKPAPRPQAKAPLGTQLTSGSRCPQAGTWVCDHHEALGGNRRFFSEGETLASVMVPAKRDLWQQLRGAPVNRPQETVWTLAEISAPKAGR